MLEVGDQGNNVRVTFPRDNTEGEVIFQHVWLATCVSGVVSRPRLSVWFYIKALAFVVWLANTVYLLLSPGSVDIPLYCMQTMGMGFGMAVAPTYKARKRPVRFKNHGTTI